MPRPRIPTEAQTRQRRQRRLWSPSVFVGPPDLENVLLSIPNSWALTEHVENHLDSPAADLFSVTVTGVSGAKSAWTKSKQMAAIQLHVREIPSMSIPGKRKLLWKPGKRAGLLQCVQIWAWVKMSHRKLQRCCVLGFIGTYF